MTRFTLIVSTASKPLRGRLNHQVLAVLSGRIRMNFVRIVPGDKVKVVLSPYDLTRGRITWRVKG